MYSMVGMSAVLVDWHECGIGGLLDHLGHYYLDSRLEVTWALGFVIF